MQTVAQTIELVSYITATPRNRVNQLARALVTAGVFPKSVGRDVKKIDAGQMLGLIAAVGFADNVADAPAIASSFMALPIQAGDTFDGGDRRLAEVFTQSMTYPEWSGAELQLSVVASGYTATLKGEVVVGDVEVTGSVPFWTERGMGGWTKRSFIVDRIGIIMLRNLFRRDDIDDVSFSTGKAR